MGSMKRKSLPPEFRRYKWLKGNEHATILSARWPPGLLLQGPGRRLGAQLMGQVRLGHGPGPSCLSLVGSRAPEGRLELAGGS